MGMALYPAGDQCMNDDHQKEQNLGGTTFRNEEYQIGGQWGMTNMGRNEEMKLITNSQGAEEKSKGATL